MACHRKVRESCGSETKDESAFRSTQTQAANGESWVTRRLVFAFVLCWLGIPVAFAHFQLNINIRVVHVEHLADGLRVFLRVPTPYVLAPKLGALRADGSRAPAPFTRNVQEDGTLVHYLDMAAIHREPDELGKLVVAGHRLSVAGSEITPSVTQTRVHPGVSQPPFATLDEARRAFEQSSPPVTAALYAGDTVIDVIAEYRQGAPVYEYTFASALDPGLPGQDETANLVLDHFPDGTQVFRATGLLKEPIVVTRSALAAAWTFVVEGTRHILAGYDHVLFVLCLVIGAATAAGLLWRVTGFTVGHSLTLALGFYGYVPRGEWFVPSVELGIALSIIYAAVIAVTQGDVGRTSRPGYVAPHQGPIVVTAGIGLLHGLGFSFVLHTILRVDSPNVWQSLLAFNVGVEMGQLAVVAVTWPLFYWIMQRYPLWWPRLRLGVALPCITLAGIWAGERGVSVIRGLAQSG